MITNVINQYGDIGNPSVVTGYKVTQDVGSVLDVPKNSDNRHYQAIQEWVAEGNTIEAA